MIVLLVLRAREETFRCVQSDLYAMGSQTLLHAPSTPTPLEEGLPTFRNACATQATKSAESAPPALQDFTVSLEAMPPSALQAIIVQQAPHLQRHVPKNLTQATPARLAAHCAQPVSLASGKPPLAPPPPSANASRALGRRPTRFICLHANGSALEDTDSKENCAPAALLATGATAA